MNNVRRRNFRSRPQKIILEEETCLWALQHLIASKIMEMLILIETVQWIISIMLKRLCTSFNN